MCRCAIRAKAPLAPAKIAAMMKLIVTTRLAEIPRYSTRRLFSRTARLASPSSDRNRIVAAMPASPVVTTETAYSMKSASRGSVKIMPNRLGRPTLKPSEPPSAVDLTSAPYSTNDHLRHRVGDAPGVGDQRDAVASGREEQALAERYIAGARQHHDAERDQRIGGGDGRKRQRPGRKHAAKQCHCRHQRDHDKKVRALLHQIRLAVSRLNRPSGRNISTAAIMR